MGHNEARVLSHFNEANPRARASFPAIYKRPWRRHTNIPRHRHPPTHPLVNLSLRAVLRRVLAAVAWLLLVI